MASQLPALAERLPVMFDLLFRLAVPACKQSNLLFNNFAK